MGTGLFRKHVESFNQFALKKERLATHGAHNMNCHVQHSRLIVAFYCHEYGNHYWPKWGKSSLSRGALGGSEEAVVFLSESLAKKGFKVEIYADPLDVDMGCFEHGIEGGSVTWLSHEEFNVTRKIDIFVAWRYSASLSLGENATKRFLWLHDIIHLSVFPPNLWLQVDAVFVQSAFHKSALLPSSIVSALYAENFNVEYLKQKIVVLDNGVAESFFRDGPNEPNLFVYGSAPDRGLLWVLQAWSIIKMHVPEAVLEVYYGFTPTIEARLKTKLGGEYSHWRKKISDLLLQEGIKYVGPVDHATLSDAFSRAGFILYPTHFMETSCITLMKAMVNGAIPITSRLVPSNLESLTEGFDMGPTIPLYIGQAYNETEAAKWLNIHW
jgi:glycosyltransferase involved in cell wall biosynthesis